jgi:uncharacterized protein YjdB
MRTKPDGALSRTIHANRVPLAALSALLALSIVAACSVGDARLVGPPTPSDSSRTPSAPIPASVSVTAPATQLLQSATMPLRAVALDASGDTVSGASFTWNSSNPQVAAVSGDGILTAMQAGATSITASTGSITSNTLAMTVTAPVPPTVNTIVVTAPSYSLKLLQTRQAQAVAYDASGNVLKGINFTWSSSNTLVATVSNTGLITARLAGTTMIMAVSGSKSSPAVKFTVTP